MNEEMKEIWRALDTLIDAVLDIHRALPEGEGIEDPTWKKIEAVNWRESEDIESKTEGSETETEDKTEAEAEAKD